WSPCRQRLWRPAPLGPATGPDLYGVIFRQLPEVPPLVALPAHDAGPCHCGPGVIRSRERPTRPVLRDIRTRPALLLPVALAGHPWSRHRTHVLATRARAILVVQLSSRARRRGLRLLAPPCLPYLDRSCAFSLSDVRVVCFVQVDPSCELAKL